MSTTPAHPAPEPPRSEPPAPEPPAPEPPAARQEVRLTTHVLDVSRGAPAAGVALVVVRVADDGVPTLVAERRTNDDGRTDEPLLVGADLVPGRYELTFAVGDHFAATGALDPGTTPYLDRVPVHVNIGPDTGSVHVALLVTPWSYTTYRGS